MKRLILLISLFVFATNNFSQIQLFQGVDGITLGISRNSDLLKLYGIPSKVEITDVQIISGIKIGGNKFIHYEDKGLYFVVYKEHVKELNPVINEVGIQSPYKSYSNKGIHIGMLQDSVENIMNNSYHLVRSVGNLRQYSFYDDVVGSLTVDFNSGKLQRITMTDKTYKDSFGQEIFNKKSGQKTFNGTGISNTIPFNVGKRWTMDWDFSGDSFSVYLFSLDDKVQYYVLATQEGSGSGSSFYPDAGEYYLKVVSTGKWKIDILEN